MATVLYLIKIIVTFLKKFTIINVIQNNQNKYANYKNESFNIKYHINCNLNFLEIVGKFVKFRFIDFEGNLYTNFLRNNVKRNAVYIAG